MYQISHEIADRIDRYIRKAEGVRCNKISHIRTRLQALVEYVEESTTIDDDIVLAGLKDVNKMVANLLKLP